MPPHSKSKAKAQATVQMGQKPPTNKDGTHPLESNWTLWFDRKPRQMASADAYRNCLKKLGSFSTIEGMFGFYSYLVRPDDMQRDTSYHVLRQGLIPMWESFPKGGCWILKVKKKTGQISRLWEHLLFNIVGEAYGEPDVVGAGISIRREEDILAVWLRENSNPHIGDKWHELLEKDGFVNYALEYKAHNSSLRDHSSFRNTKLYVFAAQQATKNQPGVPQNSATSSTTATKTSTSDKTAQPAAPSTGKASPNSPPGKESKSPTKQVKSSWSAGAPQGDAKTKESGEKPKEEKSEVQTNEKEEKKEEGLK